MAKLVYLLHHGAEGNSAYGMFAEVPRVNVRRVLSATTKRPTICVEPVDSMLFNFCKPGTEHGLDIQMPIGSCVPVRFQVMGDIVSLLPEDPK